MVWMNAVKLTGAASLLAGLHPRWPSPGWGRSIGLRACQVRPGHRDRCARATGGANGWLEVTVVLSVLLGTGLGGLLASPLAADWLVSLPAAATRAATGRPALPVAFMLVLGLYLLAALLSFGVPDSRAPCRQHACGLGHAARLPALPTPGSGGTRSAAFAGGDHAVLGRRRPCSSSPCCAGRLTSWD